MEDKWLEDFIKKWKLKYFGHLRKSEDLEKIIDEEDRWEKRMRKTEKEMGKGHMGCFWHVAKRSLKLGTWQRSIPLCGQRCDAQ